MAEILKKSQFDRLALIRRQIIQYVAHTDCLIILLNGIRSALDGGCIRRASRSIFNRGDYYSRTPAARPQSIDDPASSQQHSPTVDAALFWVIRCGTRPYLEEDILQSVLRLGRVSEHFHRQRIKRTAQPIVKGAKGTLIAAADPGDHFPIQHLLR